MEFTHDDSISEVYAAGGKYLEVAHLHSVEVATGKAENSSKRCEGIWSLSGSAISMSYTCVGETTSSSKVWNIESLTETRLKFKNTKGRLDSMTLVSRRTDLSDK